jgi:hypothetical protein
MALSYVPSLHQVTMHELLRCSLRLGPLAVARNRP